MSISKIDHIVYAVPNLEKAIEQFRYKTGVAPIFGGYHTTQGTKNALVKIGERAYLELLAIDTQNDRVKSPRWMGIDLINKPQITRWALNSINLPKDIIALQAYNTQLGQIKNGERIQTNDQVLRWELSMPLAIPKIEIAPFLIDWQHSDSHPTDDLSLDCTLIGLNLTHPNPKKMQQLFQQLEVSFSIETQLETSISITLNTPKGLITL